MTGQIRGLAAVGGFLVVVQGLFFAAHSTVVLAAVCLAGVVFFLVGEEVWRYAPAALIACGPLLSLSCWLPSAYLYLAEGVLLVWLGLLWLTDRPCRSLSIRYFGDALPIALVVLVLAGSAFRIAGPETLVSELRVVRTIIIALAIFIYLRTDLLDIRRGYAVFCHAAVIGLIVISSAALIEMAAGWMADGFRGKAPPHGLMSGSEALAIYVCLTVVAVASFTDEGSWEYRGGWAVVAALALLAGCAVLLATRSRTALFATGLAVALSLLSTRFNLRQRIVFGVVVLVGCAIAVTVIADKTRVNVWEPGFAKRLVQTRVGPWKQGVELIQQRPWQGHGQAVNVYNQYLQMAVRFGIPAGLVYCSLFANSLFLAVRREGFCGVTLVLCALVALGIGEAPVGNQLGYLQWWILLVAAEPFVRQD